VFSAAFRGVVTLSLPSISPSMTLSVIRIDKFCRFARLSIFIFLDLRAPPIAATHPKERLIFAFLASARSCRPTVWNPVGN
jgi:hypothetical protein